MEAGATHPPAFIALPQRPAPAQAHQLLLDLAARLDAMGFDWGCCGSLLGWLEFSFAAGAVHELDEREAIEASTYLEAAITRMAEAAPAAGRHTAPPPCPLPPGSGA